MATSSFVSYLQRSREVLPVPEFRAPPPSPVTGVLTGSSSGSSGYGENQDDDDEIGRFLRCSARVPLLRLPDGPLPRRKKKKATWAPPVIDMRQLMDSPGAGGEQAAVDALKSAGVAFGCFQEWSRGFYKCVFGRPAYSSDDLQGDGSDDYTSAEFILSCSPAVVGKEATNADGNIFDLTLQIMIAAGLVLIYHFLFSFLHSFHSM